MFAFREAIDSMSTPPEATTVLGITRRPSSAGLFKTVVLSKVVIAPTTTFPAEPRLRRYSIVIEALVVGIFPLIPFPKETMV